jgi:hypothetical protein
VISRGEHGETGAEATCPKNGGRCTHASDGTTPIQARPRGPIGLGSR